MKRLLVLAVAIAACALIAAPALARTKSVSVGDSFFRARSVTVKRGTTVRWHWVGRLVHNVTVLKGPQSFASPTQRSGTFRHRMTRRGSYTLSCTIHPGMEMTLRVR
jgi:plastocyanin